MAFISFIKKNLWLLNIFFILLSSFLVSQFFSTFVEFKLRRPPEIPKFKGPVVSPVQTIPSTQSRIEDVKSKNFMKTAVAGPPPTMDTSVEINDEKLNEDLPIAGNINYRLVGTVVSSIEKYSLAVLVDNSTNTTGVYSIGDQIQDAVITSIERKRMYYKRGKRIEYLDLEETAKDRISSFNPAPAAPPPPSSDEGVKKIAENKYVVSQSELEKTLTNLNDVAMQARIVPNFEDGKANGFKIFNIKANSIYEKIGLKNGDVIQKINGFEINSPDKAFEVYQKLKDARAINIEIKRGGSNMTLDYTIR
jgi:general secretion pathway protein C